MYLHLVAFTIDEVHVVVVIFVLVVDVVAAVVKSVQT